MGMLFRVFRYDWKITSPTWLLTLTLSMTQFRKLLVKVFQRGSQLFTIAFVCDGLEISQDTSARHLETFALLLVTNLLVGKRRMTDGSSPRLSGLYLGLNFLTFPSACHETIVTL